MNIEQEADRLKRRERMLQLCNRHPEIVSDEQMQRFIEQHEASVKTLERRAWWRRLLFWLPRS